MISRLLGAFIRAALMVLLVATPGLLIPGVSTDSNQFAALIALFVGALVMVEYSSHTPIMIEFRDAPPFNRIRFFSLLLTVFFLTTLMRGAYLETPLADFVMKLGHVIGNMLDFTFSPVRLTLLILPADASLETYNLMRAAAGVGYFLSILTVLFFVAYIRILGWPGRSGQFNVLTNLPMFDPTAGGDVVSRLSRSARLNVIFGFLLPFIIPACIKSSGLFIDPLNFNNPQTVVWLIALWAFLPACLYMRGIAMWRLVSMIEEKRRQRYAQAAEEHSYA